jgi:hypothetical protein
MTAASLPEKVQLEVAVWSATWSVVGFRTETPGLAVVPVGWDGEHGYIYGADLIDQALSFSVTHIASGARVRETLPSLASALRFARLIAPLADWTAGEQQLLETVDRAALTRLWGVCQ